MTPVFIEICGEQRSKDRPEDAPDSFSFRVDGKLWKSHDGIKIAYREPLEAEAERTVTTITVMPDGVVSVNRVGYLNAGMIFEENVPHICVYDAGFLQLQITLRTHQLTQSVTEAGGCIDIDYSIEVGGQSESRNRLKMTVIPAVPRIRRPGSRGSGARTDRADAHGAAEHRPDGSKPDLGASDGRD